MSVSERRGIRGPLLAILQAALGAIILIGVGIGLHLESLPEVPREDPAGSTTVTVGTVGSASSLAWTARVDRGVFHARPYSIELLDQGTSVSVIVSGTEVAWIDSSGRAHTPGETRPR